MRLWPEGHISIGVWIINKPTSPCGCRLPYQVKAASLCAQWPPNTSSRSFTLPRPSHSPAAQPAFPFLHPRCNPSLLPTTDLSAALLSPEYALVPAVANTPQVRDKIVRTPHLHAPCHACGKRTIAHALRQHASQLTQSLCLRRPAACRKRHGKGGKQGSFGARASTIQHATGIVNLDCLRVRRPAPPTPFTN